MNVPKLEDYEMYWLDHNVENLVRIFDQNERKNFLRLDLNENPGGLPREFVESVLAEVTPTDGSTIPRNTPLHAGAGRLYRNRYH